MPWSRIDKEEVLVIGKTWRQVEEEVITLGDSFERNSPVALSDVTGDWYCWLKRKPVSEPEAATGGNEHGANR